MDFEKYENKLPVNLKDRSERGKAAYRAYQAEDIRLRELFKQDLFVEFDVVDNPKAEQAYAIAWQEGHWAGYQEVYGEFEKIVELIK